MALTPERGDIFLQEVEENYRRDQVRDFFQNYLKWLIAAVVLLLAAVGGWLYWQDRQEKQVERQTEEIAATYDDIVAENFATVPQRLDGLGGADNDVVRASALLTRAAVALERGDRTTALARYRTVTQDKDLPQPYRDLATVRLTALEFDTLQPQQVIARLEPLAKAGNPWFGAAGELTAMALLKQNQRARAGQMFAAIAADTQVPETMRSRAVQIAGTLGVDATASLPAATQ